MKRTLLVITLISTVMHLPLFGQTFSSLWDQAMLAEHRDLPKTQLEVLQQIVKKAQKEKAYGQLLKAELKGAQVTASIAPDSLEPAVRRLAAKAEQTQDPVLKAVWQTALWRIGQENSQLKTAAPKPVLDAALCEALAQVKDKTYGPFVVEGADSRIFGHDLLSVVGYELKDYAPMRDYYERSGNRPAACLTALMDAKSRWVSTETLDALAEQYGDLPEAGEIAISRYQRAGGSPGEQIAYIHMALDRWGGWKRMDILRNAEKELTAQQYEVSFERNTVTPGAPQTVALKRLRNLSRLTLTVYRVEADGDIDLSPNNANDLKKLKPLLQPTGISYQRTYTGHEPYEWFEDSLTIEGLPAGVYLLEYTTEPTSETVRHFYYVTDVYTIALSQPDGQGRQRIVVVDATTGQPIPRARLRLRHQLTSDNYKTVEVVADEKGEYVYGEANGQWLRVFAYTDTDRGAMPLSVSDRYHYYGNQRPSTQTQLYTDRSIYRPGQTLKAAAIIYQVTEGMNHKAEDGKAVTFCLRDANYKVVEEQQAVTDRFGTCAATFTLPQAGLTGYYTLQCNGTSTRFRVEEYKRPSFEVEIPQVTDDYKAGDTLTVRGTARSYAGVPVQGGRVSYKVVRRLAFWWWSYSRYWGGGAAGDGYGETEVTAGDTVTDGDGHFDIPLPLTLPESSSPMFYSFVVTADVTDTAGETHTAMLSVPLGNRRTAFTADLEEQVLAESSPAVTFHLRNAAGRDMAAEVSYRLDNGQWLKTQANQRVAISGASLKSGRHTLEAVCREDTLKRSFVVFSLNDQRPATETDDWFYLSDSQFPNDGKPVTLQVGSTDKDVHIVYAIFSGNTIVESGSVDRSNQLINRKLTYKEAWGNGLLLTFAWVKNGRSHTHTATIRRPVPDKQLRLSWQTFRDRLKPGQQEEWTLTVRDVEGRPQEAQLMATLYDKSLDQLAPHAWSLVPYVSLPLPMTSWTWLVPRGVYDRGRLDWQAVTVKDLVLSHFDNSVYPQRYYNRRNMMFGAATSRAMPEMMMAKEVAFDEDVAPAAEMAEATADNANGEEEALDDRQEAGAIELRENLSESAFFYPTLAADADGNVALKFTLPESLTTWRFLGIAHTADMHYGSLTAEAVAQKDVMVQPNMPRFVREGDDATVSARIFNTSDHPIEGKALLRLIDPETDATVYEASQPFAVGTGETGSVTFSLSAVNHNPTLLVCQVSAVGDGFSDGEQHYLPILPMTERVTVTVPLTHHEPGTETVDLAALVPDDATNPQLTVEYTDNPAWLMIQSLPTVGRPHDDNAISQAAAYYANSLGRYIVGLNPQIKTVFELWKQEDGQAATLSSQLEKNQELKDLLLSETPWVGDAEGETEQRQRLADFFDANTMQDRLATILGKLKTLQRPDGSWPWWQGMDGSLQITVAVSEMLVRLNTMAGKQKDTEAMLDRAFAFMGQEAVKEVEGLKQQRKKGHKVAFPHFAALRWLYLCALDGRQLKADVRTANDYLTALLKKDIKNQTIYEKALTAVVLAKSDPRRSAEYVKSLKEYTVYREDMGRYYDTPRAGYSWYDYRIPTQTVAIEALQRLAPDDRQTIREMQRWLLQEKRTQAWDTPINSVNAIYAFLRDNQQRLGKAVDAAVLSVDGRPLDLPKATAAVGYVKSGLPSEGSTLTIDKRSPDTSWGAVYAQFWQPTKSVADHSAGITVRRDICVSKAGETADSLTTLQVGDRVKVRITIEADRDYDFVQVTDRRAACLEPVSQLSGYHWGYYCTPRDNATNYYFDRLPKGKQVVETEYYITRTGAYETGTCTAACAYAPEFRATTHSQTLIIK